ncbi:hypothetical protein T492DRAFT_840858 [Pavlovales sp. CCMP2436]|nr:hypothetical protein T492DRAFT_840858 [Pavlovales sp. CCMP2436]
MANVFGQLQNKTKSLEIPTITNTTTITHLNLSSDGEEQNKTRDPAKVLLRTIASVILTVRMKKNLPGSITYTRDFVWSSEDSPETIVIKWKTQMRAFVDGVSFGHCDLMYSPASIQFSGVYNKNMDYGSFTDVFYQVDRYFGSDQAKGTLGLRLTDLSTNIWWQTEMAPRPFANTYTPSQTGSKLILPFDPTIYETPLTFVSELKLSDDLETASNSIGLQFTIAENSSLIDGTLVVLGDTLKLQTETNSDPSSSTYTLKIRNLALPDPLPVLSVVLYRNSGSPDVTYERYFYWSPADTPAEVIVKWNDQMRAFVDGVSFGHLGLSFNYTTYKFSPVFDYNPAYGVPEGYGWFSMWLGSDESKDNLGLERVPNWRNPGWHAGVRPSNWHDWPINFPNKAGFFARTVKIDVFVTGSSADVPRQITFDITQTVEDYRSLSKRIYTLITKRYLDFSFFSNATEVLRDVEVGELITIYPRFYRPVLRICGSTIVAGAYTGIIIPVTSFILKSDSSRDITLDDFSLKIIQSSMNSNSYYSALFGKSTNGTTINLVNSIERIENLLYKFQEKVNIDSCTATSDSWLITTDNPSGDVQINVVPAYSTTDVAVFLKNSPTFTNNVNITTSTDWNNSDGWKVISSSTFQNNASYAANAAFDKSASTYWGSAENTFTTAGVGSQSLTIEYPQPLKISSLRFEGSTRYPGVTAPTEWTLSGSNDTTFTDIQTFTKTNWSSNIAVAFDVTAAHIEYRFYKVTFTKVTAGSGSTFVSVPDLTFITVHPIGAHLLSVDPVSSNSFKIIMANSEGRTINMLTSAMTSWKFYITILKDGRIAASGLYRLTSSEMQEDDSFKRNAIDLARASYLPLDQAGVFGNTLGFTLDRQLSQADTHVYIDNRTGQPTIVHRGSTTPRDFLVDDALIAFGNGRETQRQRRAREITALAEAKYNKPSNSTGHSLGGRLAERSGSRASIVTFNKASGLGDLPNFNFTGRSQPQIQNGSRQTDIRTRLDPVSYLSSLGRRPSGQAPLVVVPQRDQANRFLPGPVRLVVNAVKAHSLKNLKQNRR